MYIKIFLLKLIFYYVIADVVECKYENASVDK